jgi:hypothetical protein
MVFEFETYIVIEFVCYMLIEFECYMLIEFECYMLIEFECYMPIEFDTMCAYQVRIFMVIEFDIDTKSFFQVEYLFHSESGVT